MEITLYLLYNILVYHKCFSEQTIFQRQYASMNLHVKMYLSYKLVNSLKFN